MNIEEQLKQRAARFENKSRSDSSFEKPENEQKNNETENEKMNIDDAPFLSDEDKNNRTIKLTEDITNLLKEIEIHKKTINDYNYSLKQQTELLKTKEQKLKMLTDEYRLLQLHNNNNNNNNNNKSSLSSSPLQTLPQNQNQSHDIYVSHDEELAKHLQHQYELEDQEEERKLNEQLKKDEELKRQQEEQFRQQRIQQEIERRRRIQQQQQQQLQQQLQQQQQQQQQLLSRQSQPYHYVYPSSRTPIVIESDDEDNDHHNHPNNRYRNNNTNNNPHDDLFNSFLSRF